LLSAKVTLDNQEPQSFNILLPTSSMLTVLPAAHFEQSTPINDKAKKVMEGTSSVVTTLISPETGEETEVNDVPTRRAIATYLDFAFSGQAPSIAPSVSLTETHAIVDKWTTAHLEVFRTVVRGSHVGSIVGFLDHTITRAGTRELRHNLSFPLTSSDEIQQKLDYLYALLEHPNLLNEIRFYLREIQMVATLEEICSRIQCNSAGFVEFVN
jgi:DNA mismatch repair protein MutS